MKVNKLQDLFNIQCTHFAVNVKYKPILSGIKYYVSVLCKCGEHIYHEDERRLCLINTNKNSKMKSIHCDCNNSINYLFHVKKSQSTILRCFECEDKKFKRVCFDCDKGKMSREMDLGPIMLWDGYVQYEHFPCTSCEGCYQIPYNCESCDHKGFIDYENYNNII
jgi:hypothetical protein